jgi:hypothetical protein
MILALASTLACAHGAHAQSQSFYWEPEDPPYEGYPQIGTGVAIDGHTAAVGAPYYYGPVNQDTPEYDPPWEGLVNVYTTDAQRTRWTLLAVLHADDASPESQEFGKAIAMQGRRVVIAANATLRVYERRHRDFKLLDTVMLRDATVSESAPIQFVNDLLAISVLDDSGGSSVRLFRIDARGKAKRVASISPPGDPDLYTVGGISLDADARTLAVGLISQTDALNRVHLYESCGTTWRHTESVVAPGTSAVGFGSSLALRGNRLVVGAPVENQALQENSFLWGGAVHVYRRSHHRWTRVQRLAADDPAQPSYGLVGFGAGIVTNGPYVWITAPIAHDQYASDVQHGPSSLYRWNAGRLEYVVDGADDMPQGALDMSGRYVIKGNLFGGLAQLEGADITDLATLVPTEADAAQ